MYEKPFDTRAFRRTLGSFLTGVTVVTTTDRDGNPKGFTANSFTSVSLDPPLILVCIGKQSRSLTFFAESDGFAVNILSESQQQIAQAFASPSVDRFAGQTWEAGPAGNPIISNSCAWLDCKRYDYIDAGDHVIMVGRVVDFSNTTRLPLGYSRGAYVSASLERSTTARPDFSTQVLAILEEKQGILLAGNNHGILSLPHAPYVGHHDDPHSLLGKLAGCGIKAELGFVFSVIEDRTDRRLRVIHRGTAEFIGEISNQFHSFGAEQVPWSSLDCAATRIVLRRYIQERMRYRFGVYVGGSETGLLAELASGPQPSSNNDFISGSHDL